ncbi:hypothetical protein [Herbiconiux liukaitaii]|uniref:hypothetical protein n=1 Tax=Herbiconiux liukaitaii TaxID=3342799 RepID=UPI0035B84F8C
MGISSETGTLARELLWTDAAWCLDVFKSAQATEDGVSFATWMMLSINARVAYEGRKVIQSANPNVGVPHLVPFLAENESPSVEKARHAAKLLDNTKKSIEDFQAEMQSYRSAHRIWMSGRTPWFLQGIVKELGIATFDGHLVLATIPTQVRFVLPAGDSSAMRDAVIKLGTDLGEDLSAFHLMVGSAHQPTATLDLSSLEKVSWEDHHVNRFLPRQYETALGDEAKMLVLLLESDLNTLVFLLSQTSSGHEGAFFRNAMVTLWHVLVSLQTLLDTHPAALAIRVRELLASENVTTFLDSRNKRIRNTFVHYVPQDLPLDATRPLRGFVELLNPDQDLASLSALTWRLAHATRETIEMWRLGV